MTGVPTLSEQSPGPPAHAPERGPWFYRFANRMLDRLIFPLARIHVRVSGRERMPAAGPVLVVSNHTSLLDPPLLAHASPRPLTFMAKAELFEQPLLAWVVRHYGGFPVRRGEADIAAFREALRVLKAGRALYVSPEGTRSPGPMGEPHEGVVMIAQRADVPILPMGIAGAERFAPHIRRWRATPIDIRIGEPFELRLPARRVDKETLAAASDGVMERIAELLPPAYRGRFGSRSDCQRLLAPRD